MKTLDQFRSYNKVDVMNYSILEIRFYLLNNGPLCINTVQEFKGNRTVYFHLFMIHC